jgi:hypothetical protein
VTATGTFAYSTPIDIEYTVSSDKKTITFVTVNNSSIGTSGGELSLASGEKVTIPPGSLQKNSKIEFYPTNLPSIKEEMQAYHFTSSNPLKSASFSIPINFKDIQSSNDLHVVYLREDGAMKTLLATYNITSKRATFKLTDNWTFNIATVAGRSVRTTTSKSYVIVFKKPAGTSSTKKSKLIKMPYYEQPGNTCWAASSKMLTHGLTTASKAHLHTKSVYNLMTTFNIGINGGFNGFYKGKSLANILNVNYGNYFFWSSIRKKMIKELNAGHPLIYSGTFARVADPKKRITHAVLIVGYEYNSNGKLLFIMHDPRNVGKYTMYSKLLWDDMQINLYLPTEAVTLFWSDTIPSKSNSKFTLGIPTNGSFGKFYFQGKKTDTHKSIRYFLQFTTSTSNGYQWSTDEFTSHPKSQFQENINELILKLPVYNSGSSSGSAFVSVEVYEKDNPSNKVSSSQSISVAAHDRENFSVTLNLDRLLTNLKNQTSECAVSLKLSENSTVSSWEIFTNFKLTKKNEKQKLYGDAWITATSKPTVQSLTYLSGNTDTKQVTSEYTSFGLGGSSKFNAQATGNSVTFNFSETDNSYGKESLNSGQYTLNVDNIKNPKNITKLSYNGTKTITYTRPISWYDTSLKKHIDGKKDITIKIVTSGSAKNIPLQGIIKDRERDDKYIFYIEGTSACSSIISLKSTKTTTIEYPDDYITYSSTEDKKINSTKTEIKKSGFVCDDQSYVQVNLWFKQ